MFKNVGNKNAGTFTMPGVKTGDTGMMALDSNAIAAGGAFLVSELEKKDTLVRTPLTSVTYPRDITIEVGGGWVDYVSAMSVAYGMSGGSGANGVQAGGSNATPIIQASMDKGIYKAHTFSAALRVMFVDMQKANYAGRSLDSLLQDGVRLAYDKHMDENVYSGFAEYGTHGLVNHPDITITDAANGAAGTKAWSTKTAEEILKDVNDAITAVWAACDYDLDAVPNHILLPFSQYTHILNTKVTDLAETTILDYILKNNVATKTKGEKLVIEGVKWAAGAGSAASDRMIVYVNKKRFVKMDELVPLARVMSAPNVANVCYDTAYMANVSEVQFFYPSAALYVDKI